MPKLEVLGESGMDRLQTIAAFISEHWQKSDDQEMALALGLSVCTVGIIRRLLGFKRRLGGCRPITRPVVVLDETLIKQVETLLPTQDNRSIVATCSVPAKKVVDLRREWAKAFIQANWQKMSDFQLAEATKMRPSWINWYRRSIGLNRRVLERLLSASIQNRLDKTDLADALHNRGVTLEEYIELRGLKVTKEGLRQAAHNLNIETNPSARTASWYAHRYGCPRIADPQIFRQLYDSLGGLGAMSQSLGVDTYVLQRIGRMHDLEELWRRKSAGKVIKRCAICGATFTRPKRKDGTRNNPEQELHFCSRVCHGRYLGRNFGRTRHKK